MVILPRTFYDRDAASVARDLLGKIIIRTIDGKVVSGIIAETEAYRSDDPACHAYRGKTKRNSALFGPVGHTYVYMCYGIHNCLNVVSRETQKYPAGGVLIRAVIPLEGHVKKQISSKLINGPGNVTKVFAIDRSHGSIDVTSPHSEIIIVDGQDLDAALIATTGRIGISVAQDVLWRFYIKKSAKQ